MVAALCTVLAVDVAVPSHAGNSVCESSIKVYEPLKVFATLLLNVRSSSRRDPFRLLGSPQCSFSLQGIFGMYSGSNVF